LHSASSFRIDSKIKIVTIQLGAKCARHFYQSGEETMIDPNMYTLARAIHERRIEEALRQQRHWQPPENGWRLPRRWRANLGDRLITLGMRLKMGIEPATELECPVS
jgi:hypothetical protein